MDSAAVNGTFIEEFCKLNQPEVTNPHEYFIHCFPHVNNIVSQRTIDALDEGSGTGDNNPGGTGNGNSDTFDIDSEEVPSGLLSKMRFLIRTIRASGQRREALMDVITRGNTGGWWTGNDGEVNTIKPRALLLDVVTRWDATFNMLVRLHELKQVR